MVHGVEGTEPALQNPLHPPEPRTSKPKRKRTHRKSRGAHQKEKKAKAKGVGAQRVRSKTTALVFGHVVGTEECSAHGNEAASPLKPSACGSEALGTAEHSRARGEVAGPVECLSRGGKVAGLVKRLAFGTRQQARGRVRWSVRQGAARSLNGKCVLAYGKILYVPWTRVSHDALRVPGEGPHQPKVWV